MTVSDFLWITDAEDGLEHAVDDTKPEVAAGLRDGIYNCVCGHELLPCSLAAPCGDRCPGCQSVAHRPEPPSRFRRTADRLRLL